MAEGSFESTSLRYESALSSALTHFRTLLGSSNSRSWKPLQSPGPSSFSDTSSLGSGNGKGKGKELLNGIGPLEVPGVQVHRRADKSADCVRAVAEVAVSENVDLETFKAVLQTAEVRSAWDKLVEHAHTIEQVDPQTRISKTDYRLGWPASPRDTITISKTFSDSTTLIDISTSVPRSADEPAFLRPAPPYVRSHVHLLAWCIQLLPPLTPTSLNRLRITVFWQWSLKGAVFTTHHQHMAQQLTGFVDYVRTMGDQIPLISSYGRYLEMGSAVFDRSQETLQSEYTILPDDDVEAKAEASVKGMDELSRQKERRRLERALEFSLSSNQGWDVKIAAKGVGDDVDVGWTVLAEASAGGEGRITLRAAHAKIVKPETLARVTVSVQRLAGGKGLKVNGEVVPIVSIEPRDPSSLSRQLLDDTASISNASVGTSSSATDSLATTARSASLNTHPQQPPSATEIMSLLRRNYIYFTSLLQEPEAKWRHVSDAHGVTVTQLNSIDPTLTIYRAEATFVGVGVWDVFSTICTPGARMQWDKTLEDAVLLDDVNELSSLWHVKTKASWPIAPRDSVTIQTAYKSPSSVHIFSFSTDDHTLFPSIPPLIAPTIRTQTDLYGWAIEALSPTTTQITLLDQSDPKGWSNKSWTPTQMINAVAGVGDFSIKFGGPPVVTRLLGAKATLSKYDHEKGMLKTEYKAASMLPSTVSLVGDDIDQASVKVEDAALSSSTIECEIRCDCSTWAASIDIVIDPPPATVSCLSRHRLSSGGGLWVTIEHDALAVSSDRILVIVRKGSSAREKGSVTVNGAKATVDVEMLPEDEVKLLAKRKRVKASPIPLDQYSTHGPHIRQPARTASGRTSPAPSPSPQAAEDPLKILSTSPLSSSPLAQGPPNGHTVLDSPPTPPPKLPLQPPAQALDALSWLQTFHAEQGPELTDPAPGWAIVSERAGTVVRKKIIPRVSDVLPVYRGDKIVQGLMAEEIASIISAVGCRKTWDERVETAVPLASYGHGCSTFVMTTKPSFPFKGRVFHIATANAQVRVPSASASASTSTVLFSASASYTPDDTFDPEKVNPTSLLPANVLLEGWILETLDPYTSSILAIPSTRCTYVACVDHSGSVPLAQSVLNANISRLIGAVETLGKTKGPLPRLWTPDTGLQIEGALSDDGDQECVWKLGNVEPGSVMLSADFSIEDGAFRSLFHITAPSAAPALPLKPTPIAAILKSELPKSASPNFAAPASNLTLQRPGARELIRRASAQSLRSTPSPAVTTTGPTAGSILPVKRSLSPTQTDKTSSDLVVTELVVDLKQFPHGYAIVCSSSLASDTPGPLSNEPLRMFDARHIPLTATVHEAPLPSIVSASLDSWKRHNHLVRILVPTSAITNPVQDPLREGKPKPSPPEWFKKLSDRGAVVDVRVVPLAADDSAKAGGTRVLFNGERLTIAGQKESRGVLARMEDEDWFLSGPKISRVPRKRKASSETDTVPSLLPKEFQEPIAVATRLLTPQASTPLLDDSEFPDPKSPRPVSPSFDDEKQLKSPPLGSRGINSSIGTRREHAASDASTSSQLMGILGAYPLSRLSSSMTSNTMVQDGPTSIRTRRTYTLSFVLLVALISFLLGSLLRSLLTPADYILYAPQKGAGEQVERVLTQAFEPHRRWREAKRLVEIRSFFFSHWDLILAVVRREQ